MNFFIYTLIRNDSSSGTFTVPSGGDGFYYFSVYLIINPSEFGFFDVEINGERVCTVVEDQEQSTSDYGSVSCSGVTYAVEG